MFVKGRGFGRINAFFIPSPVLINPFPFNKLFDKKYLQVKVHQAFPLAY